MSAESPVSTDAPVSTGPGRAAGRHRKVRKRRGPLLGGCVLGVLMVVWVAAALLLGDTVPRGTTVLGVPIGDLAPDAAERRLRMELADRASAPIPVTVGSEDLSIDPDAIGLGLDAEATVEATGAGSWNPVTMLRRVGEDREVTPVASVDEASMTRGVAAFAAQVDRDPVQGDVTFNGATIVPVMPASGRRINREAAATELTAAYLQTRGPVALTTEEITPAVTDAEVQRAVTEFAMPAVAAPVTLVSADQRVEISPAELGTVLSMNPDKAGRLRPDVAGAALVEAVRERVAGFEQPPRDARIVIVDGAPKIEPSVTGRVVDGALVAKALLSVLPRATDRVAPVQLEVLEPALTTSEAESLGVREVVSEFTTKYPNAGYRRLNIGRAAEKINGTLLEPGETFSLNTVVGERTVENGFTTGTVISRGLFVDGLGGGVSQVATTTFNAAFFAGLEDIEHKPHSVYISRYTVGREATVAWNQTDLRFRNDTPHGVLIQTVHDVGRAITVRLWSTKNVEVTESRSGRSNIRQARTIYDTSPECEAQAPTNGFDITVKRLVKRGGVVVHDDTFFTKYNAANRIICRPDPADLPARTAPPSPSVAPSAAPTAPTPTSPAPTSPAPTSPAQPPAGADRSRLGWLTVIRPHEAAEPGGSGNRGAG